MVCRISTVTSFLSCIDWQPEVRIKETAVKEARIKRAWKGRRDDNMEREKRKSDEVLIVESKNGVC